MKIIITIDSATYTTGDIEHIATVLRTISYSDEFILRVNRGPCHETAGIVHEIMRSFYSQPVDYRPRYPYFNFLGDSGCCNAYTFSS